MIEVMVLNKPDRSFFEKMLADGKIEGPKGIKDFVCHGVNKRGAIGKCDIQAIRFGEEKEYNIAFCVNQKLIGLRAVERRYEFYNFTHIIQQ